MKRALGTLVLAVVCLSTFTFAHDTRSPRINKRYHNQQARIHQGVRSGQLTPREAYRLQRQQGHIRRETRRIYRQKHDAQYR